MIPVAGKQNEKMAEAERLYRDGVSLINISQQLGVPPGTVRRWKSTHHWGGEQGERSASARGKKRTPEANARNKQEKAKRETEKKMIAAVEANEELTEKQRLFCVFYVQSFNATQSYLKAYGGNYAGALASGPRLLGKVGIRAEIKRLKEIKNESLLLGVEDLVEKQMKIAFADLSDYVEWGREEVPVMAMYGPVQVADPETGEKVPLTKETNVVRFKDSSQVDGSLLSEIKVGRDGASVKLADRSKALQWLSDYFLANPLDRHKVEFENKRLALEEEAQKAQRGEPDADIEDDPLTVSIQEAVKDGPIRKAIPNPDLPQDPV